VLERVCVGSMMSRDKNNQCGIASDATFALTE
jgi:hypothetical protein